MTRWDEWLAQGPPHTLTQEQRNGDMAGTFAQARFWDRQRNERLLKFELLKLLALRALKAERGQDAALSR
jgi:hypothetical protein